MASFVKVCQESFPLLWETDPSSSSQVALVGIQLNYSQNLDFVKKVVSLLEAGLHKLDQKFITYFINLIRSIPFEYITTNLKKELVKVGSESLNLQKQNKSSPTIDLLNLTTASSMFYTISILDLADYIDLELCTKFMEAANRWDLNSQSDISQISQIYQTCLYFDRATLSKDSDRLKTQVRTFIEKWSKNVQVSALSVAQIQSHRASTDASDLVLNSDLIIEEIFGKKPSVEKVLQFTSLDYHLELSTAEMIEVFGESCLDNNSNSRSTHQLAIEIHGKHHFDATTGSLNLRTLARSKMIQREGYFITFLTFDDLKSISKKPEADRKPQYTEKLRKNLLHPIYPS